MSAIRILNKKLYNHTTYFVIFVNNEIAAN